MLNLMDKGCRDVLHKLLQANNTLRQERIRGQRGDTSQHGAFDCFRNERCAAAACANCWRMRLR